VAYGLRKISPFHSEPGVSYAELLRDAEETIFEKFAPKSKSAKVNSVANRERQIATLLLSNAISEIPDAELLSMLSESGLEVDACKKTLAELRNPALGAGAIFSAGKLLGKKKTRDLMLAILTSALTKYNRLRCDLPLERIVERSNGNILEHQQNRGDFARGPEPRCFGLFLQTRWV
jgi:hypothetical protein